MKITENQQPIPDFIDFHCFSQIFYDFLVLTTVFPKVFMLSNMATFDFPQVVLFFRSLTYVFAQVSFDLDHADQCFFLGFLIFSALNLYCSYVFFALEYADL